MSRKAAGSESFVGSNLQKLEQWSLKNKILRSQNWRHHKAQTPCKKTPSQGQGEGLFHGAP